MHDKFYNKRVITMAHPIPKHSHASLCTDLIVYVTTINSTNTFSKTKTYLISASSAIALPIFALYDLSYNTLRCIKSIICFTYDISPIYPLINLVQTVVTSLVIPFNIILPSVFFNTTLSQPNTNILHFGFTHINLPILQAPITTTTASLPSLPEDPLKPLPPLPLPLPPLSLPLPPKLTNTRPTPISNSNLLIDVKNELLSKEHLSTCYEKDTDDGSFILPLTEFSIPILCSLLVRFAIKKYIAFHLTIPTSTFLNIPTTINSQQLKVDLQNLESHELLYLELLLANKDTELENLNSRKTTKELEMVIIESRKTFLSALEILSTDETVISSERHQQIKTIFERIVKIEWDCLQATALTDALRVSQVLF